jgi:hypothetical protein
VIEVALLVEERDALLAVHQELDRDTELAHLARGDHEVLPGHRLDDRGVREGRRRRQQRSERHRDRGQQLPHLILLPSDGDP